MFDTGGNLLKEMFEKVDFEERSADSKKKNMKLYPAGKELTLVLLNILIHRESISYSLLFLIMSSIFAAIPRALSAAMCIQNSAIL